MNICNGVCGNRVVRIEIEGGADTCRLGFPRAETPISNVTRVEKEYQA